MSANAQPEGALTERDSGGGTPTTDGLSGSVLRQIGHHLRLAREERGETLQEIAALLRIRRVYLQDLENGDLSAVPGRAYALGFLRSYGDYLGFNGEAIVEEVKRTDEPLPESPTLQVREPLPESHRPPLVLVAASLLLAASVYVGWQYWYDDRQPPPREIASVERPARATAGAGGLPGPTPPPDVVARDGDGRAEGSPRPPQIMDAVTGVTATAAVGDADFPPLPPIPEPPMPERADALSDAAEISTADGDAAVTAILDRPAAAVPAGARGGSAVATEAEGTTPTSAAEATARAGADEPIDLLAVVASESGGADLRTFGDAEPDSRVVLVASEPSWVQVKSVSGDYVWTRTLEPGDAYFVPAGDDLALWTGNAGGLKVVVDGEPLARLGQPGQVRRDISLAADALSAQYARN
jgi:cytoskeleton protein RodZ